MQASRSVAARAGLNMVKKLGELMNAEFLTPGLAGGCRPANLPQILGGAPRLRIPEIGETSQQSRIPLYFGKRPVDALLWPASGSRP